MTAVSAKSAPAVKRTALSLILATLAVAGATQAQAATPAIFDPPLTTQRIPAKSDNDPVGELFCTYYPDLMIRQSGTDTPAPNAATIIPGAHPPCDAGHAAGEIALKTANFSLDGRKGRFLVFSQTDPNGAVPFMVLDIESGGRVIYTDGTAADRGIHSAAVENGGLRLRYTRGFNAPCSIMQDAAGCWAKLTAEGRVPKTLAAPSPQACAAAYRAAKAGADDPSVITYDVDMTIDPTGKTQVLSRGAVGCDAMP